MIIIIYIKYCHNIINLFFANVACIVSVYNIYIV